MIEHTNEKQLMQYARDLNRIVSELKEKTAELQDAYLDTIQRLVLASEYRDEDTGDHIVRMSRYSALLSRGFGFSDKECETIQYASPMHDVGKIGIPDNILLKPGKLTNEEFDIIKTHTGIGAKILGNAKSEILQSACEISLSHHEKWNGRGYPRGLSGIEIPASGRIVAIADVFDALVSKRPYKKPFPVEVSIDIIKKEKGEHFDPDIVDIFLNNIDEILRIKTEIDSSNEVSLSHFYTTSQNLKPLPFPAGEGDRGEG